VIAVNPSSVVLLLDLARLGATRAAVGGRGAANAERPARPSKSDRAFKEWARHANPDHSAIRKKLTNHQFPLLTRENRYERYRTKRDSATNKKQT